MKEQPELTIVEVPIDELTPYENNANIHTNEQIDQIAASIEEFGFCDPIGIWEDADGSKVIVEGHGRALAAKRLGLDKVPVIYLNALSDDQRRAYTHVHNQLTRNSSFDFEILDRDITELDFDWDDFGFDVLALADSGEHEEPYLDDEPVSREEIDAYAEAADEELKSYNIIISCMDETEVDGIRKLLGLPDGARPQRFYRAAELLS